MKGALSSATIRGSQRLPIPSGMRQLWEPAGREAALTIVLHYGGARIMIPQRLHGTKLAALVGEAAAKSLVESLAGQRLDVPLSNRILALWLREKGWSQEQIARQLRISRRTVQIWEKQGGLPKSL